ncbi:MAG: LacI family DNA-binding transcriptional regulator [Spirochaetia bacterium]|nr:LacI family DNA-binding transcriptional regulator [Spirochaetia bacterium]
MPAQKQRYNSSITRNDVAQMAGVSSATVSRVFNAPHNVGREKREAVFEAANQLGYRPNKSASALRRKGTGIITLVEFKKPKRNYYWGDLPNLSWFYADIVRGITKKLDNTMFSLNIETVHTGADLKHAAEISDGLLCYDVDMHAEAEAVKALGTPYILAHHTKEFTGYNRCSTDNFLGGSLQAGELFSKGSRRPVYITGLLEEVGPHKKRLEGFMDFYAEKYGIKPAVITCSPGRDGGESVAGEVAQMLKMRRCDGIAAVNDVTLIGVLKVLYSNYTEIRDNELPLCGYDSVPFRDLLPYTFASVDVLPGRLYARAAEILVKTLAAKSKDSELVSEVVSPSLSPSSPPT